MKRLLLCMAMLSVSSSAWAADDAPYYGPMKRWHGIGYKFGYEDKMERDGSWRTDAAIHGRGEAVDMALYRVAERAQEEGYRFVFILGGEGWSGPGMNSATIYARPSHDPVAPTGCRSKKGTGCYTADVSEVLRVLGGPTGAEPGVAIADHQDQFGRSVFISGFGIGAVAAPATLGGRMRQTTIVKDGGVQIRSAGLAPLASGRPYMAFVPAPRPPLPAAAMQSPLSAGASAYARSPGVEESRDAALKGAQPVRGGDRKQGWTISD